MRYIIKKGRHRFTPVSFMIWRGKQLFRRQVLFYPSCKYELPDDDMWDTNKLFGFAYFFNLHRDSARFGWRYNSLTGKIQLSAYCYVNGERIIQDIMEIPIYGKYDLTIRIEENWYVFEVKVENGWNSLAGASVPFTHKKKWQFALGCYFGGNKVAPNKMEIEMKKL